MKVASKKLSKELYSLSGWDDCTAYWGSLDGEVFLTDILDPEDSPAYDLGYLLRKLPNWSEIQKRGVKATFKYMAKCDPLQAWTGGEIEIAGNTPEDAACKLAIELFKQGILTKQGVGNGNNTPA